MQTDRPPARRQRRGRRMLRLAGSTSALLSLTVMAACSGDGDDDTSAPATTAPAAASVTLAASPTTAEPAPETTAATPTTEPASASTEAAPDTTAAATSELSAEALSWALEYTGGTEGAATGAPFVIGLVDSAEYPADPAISAMAEFINAELGGIDGRPIELVLCDGTADPAGCADQFAEDPEVAVVIENLLFADKIDFQEAFDARKPWLTVDPSAGTEGSAFFSGPLQIGAASGLVGAGSLEGGAGRIAMIADSGQAILAGIAAEVVAPGAEVVHVEVAESDGADVAAVAAAIEAAGAEDADVVIGFQADVCDTVADAVAMLEMTPTLVVPYWCVGPDAIVVGEQVDLASPDLASGEVTMLEVIDTYADAPVDLTVESGVLVWPAADLLLLTRVLNDIGVDNASTGLQDALAAYDGPVLLGAGNAACGVTPPTIIRTLGACTTLIEVTQRSDGALVHVDPVDLNQ